MLIIERDQERLLHPAIESSARHHDNDKSGSIWSINSSWYLHCIWLISSLWYLQELLRR